MSNAKSKLDQSISASLSIRRCCFGLLLTALAIEMALSSGCRSLRNRLPDSRTVRARQLSLRGADLLRRNRYDDAQTLFTEAINNCPSDERAHWGYAATLWEDGNRDEAIKHMQQAVLLSGNNPEFSIRLGEMYLAQGNSADAKIQAEKALKQHRDRSDAWALLGDSQLQANDPNGALDSYHRALMLQPDFPRVQISIAQTYRQLGRPGRALATVDRLIDTHPIEESSGEPQLIRGLALVDLGRRDEAALALKSAATGIPADRPDRQVELINAQYQLGELVDARMSLGKLLQNHPEHPAGWQLRTQLDDSFETLAQQTSLPGRILR